MEALRGESEVVVVSAKSVEMATKRRHRCRRCRRPTRDSSSV